MNQRHEPLEQIKLLKLADIVTYHMQLIGDLVEDFFDEINKQQTEMKQQNRSVHTIIKNVDDFVKLTNLQMTLMDKLPMNWDMEREHKKRVDDFIKANPEAEQQINKILKRFHDTETKGEIDGGRQ